MRAFSHILFITLEASFRILILKKKPVQQLMKMHTEAQQKCQHHKLSRWAWTDHWLKTLDAAKKRA